MIKISVRKSIKCNGEYSAFVSFPYNASLVSKVRSYPQRWYNPDNKEWEIQSKELDDFLDFLGNRYDYDIEGLSLLTETKKVKLPKKFTYKTKPFKHQEEGIRFGLKHDRWLLGDTMGLGKTKCAIDLAVIKKLQKGYKHCFIICGVNGLKWNWVEEIKTHSDEGSYILGQKIKNGKIKIGSTKDKLDDVNRLHDISQFFIITNIETLRDEKVVAALSEQCHRGEIGMIVLDEAHCCKNPNSQQGKGVLKLSADTMLAMTGTPLMNTPIDLYFILRWLGYEKHSFYAFKNYYCVMGGYGNYQIVGYKHLETLQAELNSFMLRRLKEDVFDLPDKIYVNEYVEMTPKQKQVYDEVTQDIKMNIDKIVSSPNPLTELIRMRQATGYTGILSTKVNESAKIDRLIELIEEAKSNNQKVVIFSNWTQMTDPVDEHLKEAGFKGLKITGDTKDFVRQDYVNRFQSREVDYIIGTIGAMGTGITLTAGTIEIFLDEPWNKALKEQAVDRCHRIGTKSSVTIYTLIAKNTIDERIHEILENKGIMADAIVDGKIAGSKKELLEFLLN